MSLHFLSVSWQHQNKRHFYRHFAFVYLFGITRLQFIRSTAQEPSIYIFKSENYNVRHFPIRGENWGRLKGQCMFQSIMLTYLHILRAEVVYLHVSA